MLYRSKGCAARASRPWTGHDPLESLMTGGYTAVQRSILRAIVPQSDSAISQRFWSMPGDTGLKIMAATPNNPA
jgi:hypothetical protein